MQCHYLEETTTETEGSKWFYNPMKIGNLIFKSALCDLRAIINLMPLSIFRRLGLDEARPMTMTLRLVDRSLKHPGGGGCGDIKCTSKGGQVYLSS